MIRQEKGVQLAWVELDLIMIDCHVIVEKWCCDSVEAPADGAERLET